MNLPHSTRCVSFVSHLMCGAMSRWTWPEQSETVSGACNKVFHQFLMVLGNTAIHKAFLTGRDSTQLRSHCDTGQRSTFQALEQQRARPTNCHHFASGQRKEMARRTVTEDKNKSVKTSHHATTIPTRRVARWRAKQKDSEGI